MRTYEALYITRSEKTEDEIQTMANGVETLITESGGSIVRSEVWGKRRLAYKVNGITEGVYILVRFQSEPEFIQKLRDFFRLAEDIMRHSIVFFDEKTLALEAEQEAKNKALAEARIASGSTFGGRSRSDDDDDDDRPRRPRREDSRPAPARPGPRPAEAPKAETSKAEEAKPEEAKADEPKAAEAKVAEPKPAEPVAEAPSTETAEAPPAADTPDAAPEPATEVKA